MRKRDMKRKDIMRKVKVIRKHVFQRQSSPGSKGSGYEMKIKMLRRNNSSLARALSDQKIETNHWYTEAITLKGEVQQLQEKQLKEPVINMNVENMFGETEKQIKEYYESIDKDFNSALDKIVKAVEKITKVKQLVNGIQNIMQSYSQTPSSIFTRMPGSRVTLGSGGVSTSPRQRAVPPMVGGHVLQPAMVPLPKLKINWNDRSRNQFLVCEGNDHVMSTIGEQSSPETSVVIEEQQSLDAEGHQLQNDVAAIPDDNILQPQSQNDYDTTNPESRLSENTPRRYSLRRKTISSPELKVTSPVGVKVNNRSQSRRSRGRKSGRGRGSSSRLSKSSPAKASEKAEGKEVHRSIPDDDPLEGPSWLLDVGRSRFHTRGQRGKRPKRTTMAGDAVTYDSSDEDTDETVVISPKLSPGGFLGSRSRRKVITPKNIPLSLDHSCLDFPTSMLSRLEALEAAGGRKCKRLIKRKKQIVNSDTLQANGEDASLSLEQDKQVDQGTIPSRENIMLEFCTPNNMAAGVDSIKDNNKEVPYNTSSAFICESPGTLREDNNITCKIITNMDMTMPVSNSVIQENPATSIEKNTDILQDEFTLSKKKFFKTREMEFSEEIPGKVERTPFDISMINESVVEMPPFSSTRKIEKENLPPLLGKHRKEYASLCNVSVVLEDVMKQPRYSKTPSELLQSPQKESQSAKCISSLTPKKLRSVNRRTLQYTVNHEEDNEEIIKPKRARKTRKKREFTPELELESIKTSSTKSSNNNEDNHTELQESEDEKAQVLLSDTDTIGKEDLEKCFVLVKRTPTAESPPLIEAEPQEVLSDLHQQQQPSENRKNPERHEEEVETASDASPDAVSNSCSSSCVETEINTDHIEKKEDYKEDIQTGRGSDKPENTSCIVPEDPCDEEQVQEAQGTYQEQIARETHGAALSPNSGFEGFQSSETSRNFKKVPVKESSVECNYDVQNFSDSKSNAETGDCCRRRRAAQKITSFKEVGLNRKMRRGKNDVIIIEDSEKGKSRARGRSRGRGKSSAKGRIVETEVAP